MSGILNSNLNGSNSNLAEATGRPFASSFAAQSANTPSFHHSGSMQALHNIHGSFVPNIPPSLASRNTSMAAVPSNGRQQPGSLSCGFICQKISHGDLGIPDRGGIGFSSSLNGVGGSIHGVSSSLAYAANRNSIPGMGANPILGNFSPRMSSSVGNIPAGGNIGRTISSGGLNVSSLASRTNLGASGATGALIVQGPNRLMCSMLSKLDCHYNLDIALWNEETMCA